MKCRLASWVILGVSLWAVFPGRAESPVEGTELAAAKAKRAQAMSSMDYAMLFAQAQRAEELAQEATRARKAAEQEVASLKAAKGGAAANPTSLAAAEKALALTRKDEEAKSENLKTIRKNLTRAKARTEATAERVAAVNEALETAQSQPTQPETPKEETRP